VLILAGVIAAICWNLLTWWLGIPSSSSHTLVVLQELQCALIANHGFSAYIGADGATHYTGTKIVSWYKAGKMEVCRVF
jgi:PiT family inorganic phosphate transporter